MHLSRVEVGWESARNPYELHRALWRLFPGAEGESRHSLEEARQGFLFRVEESRPGRPARLLVQSCPAPRDGAQPARLIATREFDPRPSARQILSFLLTANPIKTIVDEGGRRDARGDPKKCRVPLILEDEQRQWLERKLAGAVDILDMSMWPHPPLYFRKRGTSGKLCAVTYQGAMRVKDPERLVKQLRDGVGPAKAFGCGLLLVRRAD